MASLFDTIADDTRRHLLENLRIAHDEGRELSVNELVEALGVSQPTVSKHLKVLREADVVSVRLEGQRRFYALAPEALAPVVEWVDKVAGVASPDPAVVQRVQELEQELAQALAAIQDDTPAKIVPRNNPVNRAGERIGEALAEIKVRGVEALDGAEAGLTYGVDAAREVSGMFIQTVAERVVRPVLNAFSRER